MVSPTAEAMPPPTVPPAQPTRLTGPPGEAADRLVAELREDATDELTQARQIFENVLAMAGNSDLRRVASGLMIDNGPLRPTLVATLAVRLFHQAGCRPIAHGLRLQQDWYDAAPLSAGRRFGSAASGR